MLAYVRKFVTAVLGNGAVIAELSLIDNTQARELTAILTLVATMLGVYAVPNGATRSLPPASR